MSHHVSLSLWYMAKFCCSNSMPSLAALSSSVLVSKRPSSFVHSLLKCLHEAHWLSGDINSASDALPEEFLLPLYLVRVALRSAPICFMPEKGSLAEMALAGGVLGVPEMKFMLFQGDALLVIRWSASLVLGPENLKLRDRWNDLVEGLVGESWVESSGSCTERWLSAAGVASQLFDAMKELASGALVTGLIAIEVGLLGLEDSSHRGCDLILINVSASKKYIIWRNKKKVHVKEPGNLAQSQNS